MLLAWQKKRKGPGEADDESDDYPAWVLSPRLFDLYLAGKKPPAEVQLSAKAAKEVKRLKAWALAQDPRAAPAPEQLQPPPPPPMPPPIAVTALPVPAGQFDPAVLARVAAIKNIVTGRNSPSSAMTAL